MSKPKKAVLGLAVLMAAGGAILLFLSDTQTKANVRSRLGGFASAVGVLMEGAAGLKEKLSSGKEQSLAEQWEAVEAMRKERQAEAL